jgi:hypothetical protein
MGFAVEIEETSNTPLRNAWSSAWSAASSSFGAFRILWLVAILLCRFLPGTGLAQDMAIQATELLIVPQDEGGQSVWLSSAEVFLETWYGSRRIALSLSERGVTVPLDRGWLCEVWPERCHDEYLRARLLFRAAGLAPIASRLFVWPGGLEHAGGAKVTAAKIALTGRPATLVSIGSTRTLVVKFRKPAERVLRFVDDDGSAVADVKIHTYIFLTNANHCGRLDGESLGESSSDASGRATIADGDVEYAFQLEKDHYVLRAPRSPDHPMELIRELVERETTIELHQRRARPLELAVRTTSGPVPGAELEGCLSGCPGGTCGACCGVIAAADGQGKIRLEEFYPEDYATISVSDDRGDVWSADPREIPSGEGELMLAPSRDK